MTSREAGFLLLTSHLGDPERHPLTVAQFRNLANRVMSVERTADDRQLQPEDLEQLGYDRETALRILKLLGDTGVLFQYLRRGSEQDCDPITRISPHYPLRVRKKLGLDAPGCLWAKGDVSLLEKPAVSLVGSRELKQKNRIFAEEVGRQAALQGFVLVSGNARGADQAAQNACLRHGGQVISVVADDLSSKPLLNSVLWLSEEAFDVGFTSQRALSRNRIIHCLGTLVFAAQSDLEQGGTWDGTCKNLRHHWSSVFCYGDGTEAMEALQSRGAAAVDLEELKNIVSLTERTGQIQMEEFYE